MNNNELISLYEIEQITNHCLNVLFLTDQLSDIQFEKNNISNNLRKLFITSLFSSKTIICIAGLQGAGKTTMMRNFYELDEKLLPGTLGRGERIPVFITENDVCEPCLYAVKLVKETDEQYSKKRVEFDAESYRNYTSGEDTDIMYVELIVPYKHTFNSNISFMLLPGYEQKSDEWRELVSFSVHSSDAAVFVFDEGSFANVNNEECLNDIGETFGSNLVYAITRADSSADKNKGIKQTCMNNLQINSSEADRIVCVGSYFEAAENQNWIAEFKKAIEKYAIGSAAVNRTKNAKFLYNTLVEIKNDLSSINQELLKNKEEKMIYDEIIGNRMLNAFDKALRKKREDLENNLNNKFGTAMGKSVEILEEEISKTGIKPLKRTFFGGSVNDKYTRPREIIEKAMGIGNSSTEPSLPDKYLRLALQDTLKLWDRSSEAELNTNGKSETISLLDTKKEDGKLTLVPEGKKSKALVNDVKNILTLYDKDAVIPQLQVNNDKQLMRAIVEMSTYCLSMSIHDELSEKTGSNYYSVSNSELTTETVVGGAESTKKLAVGLAGVIGVDLIGDGQINMVSQLASSLGMAVPIAGIAVAAIVGAGVVSAVAKDINRMKCDDFISARNTINNIYDNLKDKALKLFDDSMEKVKDRIIDNIDYLSLSGRKNINTINVQIELNNALNLLYYVAQRNKKHANNPMALIG